MSNIKAKITVLEPKAPGVGESGEGGWVEKKNNLRRNLRELASLVSGVVGEETPAKKHTQSGALL